MVFNKSWNYLKSDWSSTNSLYGYEDEERKRHTVDNNYQTTIPQFDPKIDETTGWKGVEPVTAIRIQGNHRKAGQAVPQDGSNINFEEGDPKFPQRIPETPDDDDSVWNDSNSRWSKDPKSGARYYMSGASEDGNYSPHKYKHFADLKNAKAGTWAGKNTIGDIDNLFTHNEEGKIVYIRGSPDKYGKVHRRNSDEAREGAAEMFIEHEKDIPRENLVEVPLKEKYRFQTRNMGTPDLGHNRRSKSDKTGRVSSWSDKPVPWGESREPTKKIEDMNDDEFQEFQESLYDKTPEEIYELTKGSPMDIAFQLLKAGNTGSVRGMGSNATDNIYHYPHELDYGSMDQYMGENPDATLGSMVTPYLQGQFTNNPPTNPPAYQSERPTQLQSTVPAPFPQTPEQTKGVQNLINEGFDDYESRDSVRKPHYDNMNNAVRVLSRNLRGNPAYNFTPPGRLRGTKGRGGRSRQMQNMKLRSMLETPVSQSMAEMNIPKQGIPIAAGEPMDIAFLLLKAQQTLHSYDPESVEELLHPDKRTVVISSKPNWVNEENPMSEEKQSDLHDNLLAELGALKNKKDMKIISARGKSVEWGDEHSIALSNVPDHHFDNIMGLATKYEQDSVLHSPKGTSSGELLKPSGEVDFPLGEGGFVDDAENMTEFGTGQRFAYGEPMDIALQLLKERKSPAAFAHKLEYDKQYQKTPKRVKYREQLNAERRRRGIYGKGGADVSHTQGGKLTLESAHANRARHFKNKGTLRRVKVKK